MELAGGWHYDIYVFVGNFCFSVAGGVEWDTFRGRKMIIKFRQGRNCMKAKALKI